MEKVRFGIIGYGNMGSGHAKNFDEGKIENGVLTAIADINPQKLELAKNTLTHEVTYFNTAEALMDSKLVDAIIIAVPHYFHPPLTIMGLNKGLHVISEKPAGVYTKQVKEMNAVAAKSDKLFTIMFNQRTNCVYRKMREMILDGALGDIKRITWIITDWYRSQSYYNSSNWRATWAGEGGGVLFNQCPHQIDLLQWITGMMPARIQAHCHFGKWHDIEVEDDVTAYLEYDNGATGVFITSTGEAPGANRFEISGDKGSLLVEHNKLIFRKLDISEREFNRTFQGGFGNPGCTDIEVETDGDNPQHVGIVNNFANAILGLEPLFVDGKEGLKGVEIMDGMMLSQWLGKTVTLPIDDDLYYSELQKRIATSKVKTGQDVVLDTAGTYGGTSK